ncbi:hypothetical protein [Thiohalomonas denitrificans]|uniref:Uncharacterized protein n=1 Tax=Thiohalomonas denitrificans TaxID=415747 RepID=A0A1G5PIT1_9GAMM|nr:hypothetical protein [Thiohalomonas denitrificans]SCZ49111.1 hypothetical protein SAMN03097708_00049 [Thiohalomonas denitrificans]
MSTLHPADVLRQLATEFHHRKQENKEKAGHHSQQRRHHEKELEELQTDFESILQRWVDNEPEREAWRAHFYHFEPVPAGPELEQPPLFRGRSSSGGVLEICKAPGPAYEIILDGTPVRRTSEAPGLTERRIDRMRFEETEFEEVFDAPEEAQAPLADFYDGPRGAAPWEYSRSLFSDGLIDANFGLTERGQRWLDTRRQGREGGVQVWL